MRLIRLFKHDIAHESAEWVHEQLITEPQAEAICRRYGVDFHDARRRSWGYWVLVLLGYLFIGLALLTLIGANWQEIPRGVRMGGLLLLTAATQMLALHRYDDDAPGAAIGLFFLGNLFFGAAIALIGQIYHLGEHMPDGLLLWALGTLPFGLLLRSPLLGLQSLLIALLWFRAEASMGFYPGALILFIIAAIGVLRLSRHSSTLLFLTTVAALTLWLEFSLAWLWHDAPGFAFHAEHLIVSFAFFILTFAFSYWLHRSDAPIAKDYGALLALWSLRLFLLYLVVMSFRGPWELLLALQWHHPGAMLLWVGGFGALSLLFAYRSGHLTLFVVLNTLFMLSLYVLFTREVSAAMMQLLYNLLAISAGIALIVEGVRSGLSHYYFLGVVTILITAVLRYVDLIGNYVEGALFFMLIAAVLIAAARFWRAAKGSA